MVLGLKKISGVTSRWKKDTKLSNGMDTTAAIFMNQSLKNVGIPAKSTGVPL